MPSGILILSAHLLELSGLAPVLGNELLATLGAREVRALAVGIGPVAAARGTASALRSFEPEAAVFVGTCGAYEGRGVGVGDVVLAGRVCLVSTAVVESRGALPGPMRTELAAN